ncbi:MAG: NADH-quinone oxidoreductase subunit M [Candidatus Handelsmanbacteria bacterium]|nr:NADH-quinone oxidoreductase subunit M [Candidatus Handelsmanbacteria bacterium]
MENWLLLALLAPLLGAVAVWAAGEGMARKLAALAAALSLAAALALWGGFDPQASGPQFRIFVEWVPQLGIDLSLGVDGISLPLIALTGLVGLAAVLAPAPEARPKTYYSSLLLLLGAAMGAFASLNIFFFYFFCELATLPKFLLVGIWGSDRGRSRKEAAMHLTLYITAGAMAALVGLVYLFAVTGENFDLARLQAYSGAHPLPEAIQIWIFGILMLGFGVWASMWPFHTWAPVAYGAAPTAANMLFAGVLKNLGAYGLIRIGLTLLPLGARYWADCLAILAAINILYAGWVALRQQDWHQLIAYSTVSHAGYLLLGIAALNVVGVSGAVLMMFAHGVLIALIFALLGAVGAQGKRIGDFGGIARVAPFLGVCTGMAFMAASGMAGFANFASEVMVFIGSWQAQSTALRFGTVAAVWGLVLGATYMLRALRTGFYGEPSGPAVADPPMPARVPYAVLLAVLLLFGFFPGLLTGPIQRAVAPICQLIPAKMAAAEGAAPRKDHHQIAAHAAQANE